MEIYNFLVVLHHIVSVYQYHSFVVFLWHEIKHLDPEAVTRDVRLNKWIPKDSCFYLTMLR